VKKFFTSIWLLTFIIALPVIFFVRGFIQKYECQLVDSKNGLSDVFPKVYFKDLDSDGNIERIQSFQQNIDSTQFSIQYYSSNGGMIDQVNFPGKFQHYLNRIDFADIDNDGNLELYTFTIRNDSLLLNQVQLTPKRGRINSLAICKLNAYRKGIFNYQVGQIHCVDLENDGRNELLFTVIGGYSVLPRKVYKVDMINRKVVASENTGCANLHLQFEDLDGDGRKEIIAEGQVAPIRNIPGLPYNTEAPYLKVLDADLNYFFPPKKFCEGIQSATKTFVVHKGNTTNLQNLLNQFPKNQFIRISRYYIINSDYLRSCLKIIHLFFYVSFLFILR